MILSKKEILSACKKKLIEPYDEKLIQTCSYDLTFSGEYCIYDPKGHNSNTQLKKGQKLIIPADAICFVLTNETVNIPENLTASISLSMGLIKSGVMLAAQPPYDAGYSGKTIALLHNLSSEPVAIEVDQHILNMVFNRLTSDVPIKDRYKGKYQNSVSLDDFKVNGLKGGVYDLAESFHKEKKRFENSIPNLLMVITVILGVLTVLMAASGPTEAIINRFSSGQSTNDEPTKYDKEEMTFAIPTSDDVKEVTIYVNGHTYKINFEEATINKQESESVGESNE